MNTKEIRVRQLGLAAYIQLQGCTRVASGNEDFVYLSDVSLEEWRVRYSNSCCMKHDSLVCELRHSMKSSR